ncbi:MAG: gpW family protein [Candidatus Thiodiazotropha taylori]|uniref:GpW family protein n=1 Tax=Candidatus Thiodiazotropha taylori TaxID=2792791 RepID=A0A9E4KDS4_9GAMM|nr:gpW family protein [Candidatus Thiodiazotropha taylori]MCW4257490.1 gpW family protein [Candidatus Thiodiazotropha taylori]
MSDLSTLHQRLVEAESALHRLMIGELEVTVSVGGYGATTYAQSDINKLNAYIAKLKTEIATKERRPRRGPLFMRF